MFGEKSRRIKELERENFILRERLHRTMPEKCKYGDHDWFVSSEYVESDYGGGMIDCYTVRMLECKLCGKKATDNNKIGGFHYKVKKEDGDGNIC